MELVNITAGGANTGTVISVNTNMRKVIHASASINGTAQVAGVIPILLEEDNVDGAELSTPPARRSASGRRLR